MSTGHVFVVQGEIGRLVADAAIVSTDDEFNVEDHWYGTLGITQPTDVAKHRPQAWHRGWGKSSADTTYQRNVWFLDTASGTAEDVLQRLSQLLDAMVLDGLKTGTEGRVIPLVALPVVGTAGGGHGTDRGALISNLLQNCRRHARQADIDIAIVTKRRSTYGAIQHQRKQAAEEYFAIDHLPDAEKLGKKAANGELAVFIGAGASVPAGLPSWSDLLHTLTGRADLDPGVRESFKDLNPLDQAELLHAKLGNERLSQAVVESINHAKDPALSHALLAALNAEACITTNYDNLYEQACEAANSTSDQGKVAVVLPHQVPSGDERWVLKMHGSIERPGSIVLTRAQFANYDAGSGPSGAVLQSVLLTRHLLVVGASMTDDNVLRLIHEVSAYRGHNRLEKPSEQSAKKFGTILDVSDNAARNALQRESFEVMTMPTEDVGDNKQRLRNRARNLEIFLDCVSAYACTDLSWLLDPEFNSLLSNADKEWADRLSALAQNLQSSGGSSADAWADVVTTLRSWGAPGPTTESHDQ